MTDRLAVLDASKGFAIILVVLAHSIQRNMGFANLWQWAAIQHFHMALFIFMTGYLSYGKLDIEWLLRRFLQLIPAYIVWSFLLYCCSEVPFSGLVGIYPTTGGFFISLLKITLNLELAGLWFFPGLFILCTFMYMLKGKLPAIIILTIVLYAISQIPLPHVLRFLRSFSSLMAWFLPFFAFGYFIAKYKNKLRSLEFIKWIALFVYPVLFFIGHECYQIAPQYSWYDYTVFLSNDIVLPLYQFLMSWLGIGMAFSLLHICMKAKPVRHILCYLGTITLGIYPAHLLWLKIGFGSGIGMALSATLFSLLLSVALIWLFQKFIITDYLFLGSAQRLAPRVHQYLQLR